MENKEEQEEKEQELEQEPEKEQEQEQEEEKEEEKDVEEGVREQFVPAEEKDPEDPDPKKANKKRVVICAAAAVVAFIVVVVVALVVWQLIRWQTAVEPVKDNVELLLSPDLAPGSEDRDYIKFKYGDVDSFGNYTASLDKLLSAYENAKQETEDFVDCAASDLETIRVERSKGRVCRFDLDVLGPQCNTANQFGYGLGTPCMVLTLKTVPGFIPEPHNDTTCPDGMLDFCSPDHIPVVCKGEGDEDVANLGVMTTYPSKGFSVKYYPALEQEDYHFPLVAVHFVNPKRGVTSVVRCEVHAQNIVPSKRYAAVSFALHVD